MTKEEAWSKYLELFPSSTEKAAAFDCIAERYYCANFGSISKADFDVLMFSLYLDRILQKDQHNYAAYSDYTLSKVLGITQSKVSGLKVKKELQYPYQGFVWQESLLAISKNAVYEDGKIKLFVPDKNLFLEIKNAIETNGGFVEVQLTSTLLQVRLEYFLDLVVAVSGADERENVIKQIKQAIKNNSVTEGLEEKVTFGKALEKQLPGTILEIFEACASLIPGLPGQIVGSIFRAVKGAILNN